MRCKPGDLAISVIHSGRLRGKLCTVLHLASAGERDNIGCYWDTDDILGPAWLVKFHHPPLIDGKLFDICLFYDEYLRPITPPAAADTLVAEHSLKEPA